MIGINGSGVIPEKITIPIPSPKNIPLTEIIFTGNNFVIDSTHKSVAYVVIGGNGTITTFANGVTRPLFDGESGEFKCDEEKTFDDKIEFIAGVGTTIILNIMSI
jgi:hypothetical protein